MADRTRPELGRLLVAPFLSVGLLGAILVWTIDHVGSIGAIVAIVTGTIVAAVMVARRLGAHVRDLSRYYEALLARADEQSRRAEAANRMKDAFLATLSHELRTPLNSVIGWSRLLATGKLGREQTARAVAAIERAGWAQSRVIENLLDVSRIAEGRLLVSPRPTLVGPVVDGTVRSLQTAADAKRITIESFVDAQVGAIQVDPDRLHQVLWHLIANAVKFTPDGGRVSVKVAPDGDMLRILVTDTGVGFPPEAANRLFEHFRQVDDSATRQYGGLGLGLGIVRFIVEQHGGTIAARSAGVNRGAEFEVRLPLRQAETRAVRPAPRYDHEPILRGVSVLLVDDNAHDLEMTRTSLEQYGATVRTASSAREARERFRCERPDVLVSDLAMPEEDGLELIREIREIDERLGQLTPAAALTAMTRSGDRRDALNAGFQMHLAKPIDPLELASTIEQLARSRRPEKVH